MTSTFKRILIAMVVFIVIAIGAAALVVTGGCSTAHAGSPISNFRNDTLNTLIDVTGVKDQVDAELRKNAGFIAQQTGLPESTINNAIDDIAVKEWRVTNLPANANQTGTYAVNTDSVQASITTYDDPSVVTVDAYGQNVTMSVPVSAQPYLTFFSLLG